MAAKAKNDRAAIMAVLDAETRAFWNKDHKAWADRWHHVSYAFRGGWSPVGRLLARTSWRDLSARMKMRLASLPAPNPSAKLFKRKKLKLQIRKDVAWLTCEQHAPDTGEKELDMPGITYETKILEKRAGKWKLVYVNFLLDPDSPKERL